ncbi:hypothetical protein IWQ62_004383, partial [Dispira parvispora]
EKAHLSLPSTHHSLQKRSNSDGANEEFGDESLAVQNWVARDCKLEFSRASSEETLLPIIPDCASTLSDEELKKVVEKADPDQSWWRKLFDKIKRGIKTIASMVYNETTVTLHRFQYALRLGSEWNKRELVNPSLLRKLKLHINYAFAAYLLPEEEDQLQSDPSFKTGSVKMFTGESKTCRGFIAVSKNEREIILSFRGSSLMAISTFFSDLLLYPISWPREWSESKVHSGFARVHNKCLPTYRSLLDQYREQFPEAVVQFIGHSLGGAIAILAALTLRLAEPAAENLMQVTTYSSPKVGNREFGYKYNQLNITTLRVTNGFDVIPQLPYGFGYFHLGREIYITPEFNQRTIICQDNMDVVNEDPACAVRITWKLSRLLDHRVYWEIPKYSPKFSDVYMDPLA